VDAPASPAHAEPPPPAADDSQQQPPQQPQQPQQPHAKHKRFKPPSQLQRLAAEQDVEKQRQQQEQQEVRLRLHRLALCMRGRQRRKEPVHWRQAPPTRPACMGRQSDRAVLWLQAQARIQAQVQAKQAKQVTLPLGGLPNQGNRSLERIERATNQQ
jgi:hypothetical protein